MVMLAYMLPLMQMCALLVRAHRGRVLARDYWLDQYVLANLDILADGRTLQRPYGAEPALGISVTHYRQGQMLLTMLDYEMPGQLCEYLAATKGHGQ